MTTVLGAQTVGTVTGKGTIDNGGTPVYCTATGSYTFDAAFVK